MTLPELMEYYNYIRMYKENMQLTGGDLMSATLSAKENALLALLQKYHKPALAFSGGVDSGVLLAACLQANLKVEPILADSCALPQQEKQDAQELALLLGTKLTLVSFMPLEQEAFRNNSTSRCYHCKKALLQLLQSKAAELGCDILLDGTNADDLGDYRPGLQAVRELGVVSPLLECGFTKKDIRALAGKYQLPQLVHKPSYACLASRIAYGEEITEAKLERVEKAEAFLRKLGLNNIRVRCHGSLVRLEVNPSEIPLLATTLREETVLSLRKLGFSFITLDLEGYRSGSMNN